MGLFLFQPVFTHVCNNMIVLRHLNGWKILPFWAKLGIGALPRRPSFLPSFLVSSTVCCTQELVARLGYECYRV